MPTLLRDYFPTYKITLSSPFIRALLIIAILFAGFLFFHSCGTTTIPPRKVYRIARDTAWKSADLMNKEKNMQGFTSDLFLLISKEQKIYIEFIDSQAKDLYYGLEHGEYEAILAAIRPNNILKQKYAFSEPFFSLGPVLVVPANSHVKSLKKWTAKLSPSCQIPFF